MTDDERLVMLKMQDKLREQAAEVERLRAALEELDNAIFHDRQEIERAGYFRTIIQERASPQLFRIGPSCCSRYQPPSPSQVTSF